MFTVENLLKVLDCEEIRICYASFGQPIYRGPLNKVPNYVLKWFVTLVIPNNNYLYIEVTEIATFLDDIDTVRESCVRETSINYAKGE